MLFGSEHQKRGSKAQKKAKLKKFFANYCGISKKLCKFAH